MLLQEMYINILKRKDFSALTDKGLSSFHLYVYIKSLTTSHSHNPWIYYCFGIIKEGLTPFLGTNIGKMWFKC